MMKCETCERECRVEKGDLLYEDFGLPLLLEGIEITVCDGCGTRDPVIQNLSSLMTCLAARVLDVGRRLTGKEVRFLRKYTGLSAKEFAQKVGLDPTNLSKVENGKLPVSDSMDRLTRLVVIALSDDLSGRLKETVERFEAKQAEAPVVQPRLLLNTTTMSCRYAA